MRCIVGPGTRAHPRSRGEHARQELKQASSRGSSPLTRGALATVSGYYVLSGLIPAHAGSTLAEQQKFEP